MADMKGKWLAKMGQGSAPSHSGLEKKLHLIALV